MLYKSADDRTAELSQLQTLLKNCSDATEKRIVNKQLNQLRARVKAEQATAYILNFKFENYDNIILLHDLTLEINGKIAQIDHLIITQTLQVYVLDSQHFNDLLVINDYGGFSRWNHILQMSEGITSPIEENKHHIEVLKEAFNSIDMPKKSGAILQPCEYLSYILISPRTSIKRSRNFDSSSVIRADTFSDSYDYNIQRPSNAPDVTALNEPISHEDLQEIAYKLVQLHQPQTSDYSQISPSIHGRKTEASVAIPQPVKHKFMNVKTTFS